MQILGCYFLDSGFEAIKCHFGFEEHMCLQLKITSYYFDVLRDTSKEVGETNIKM